MSGMKRREFITLLGGAAALLDSRLPLEAQQASKIYRLGVLSPSTASVDSIRAVTVPELAKAGFVEGQNLVLDARVGVESQISELARALVASNLDAIIAVSDISIEAAKAASGTIPVVMSFGTGDPVAAGFATSITRPGRNITGVVMLAPELNAKRLTLLHEAIPKARRIAALAVSEHRYETGGGRSRTADIFRRDAGRLPSRVYGHAVGGRGGPYHCFGARVQSRRRNSCSTRRRGKAADSMRVEPHGGAGLPIWLRP
jgi:ABC transporter substrate binding protein